MDNEKTFEDIAEKIAYIKAHAVDEEGVLACTYFFCYVNQRITEVRSHIYGVPKPQMNAAQVRRLNALDFEFLDLVDASKMYLYGADNEESSSEAT